MLPGRKVSIYCPRIWLKVMSHAKSIENWENVWHCRGVAVRKCMIEIKWPFVRSEYAASGADQSLIQINFCSDS